MDQPRKNSTRRKSTAGDDLEALARRAPRAWRTAESLERAGFVRVEGGLEAALAAARLNRVATQMKALRKKAGLTRSQVARRMGTTASVISRMESEHPGNLTLDTLERFARAVGADLRLALVEIA